MSRSSLGCSLPPSWRPLAGGIALGAQFVVLWMLGRGPVIGPDGGAVVPASAALLLALTTLLTVLTPLGALFSRRFVPDRRRGERRSEAGERPRAGSPPA